MALLQMVFYDSVDGSQQQRAKTWDSVAAAATHDRDLVAAVSLLRRYAGEDWKGFTESRPLAMWPAVRK